MGSNMAILIAALVAAVMWMTIDLSAMRNRISESIELIRNGVDAPPNKYPFFAELHVRGYGLICGGTLVHERVMLTAGHCRNFGHGSLPLFMFSVVINDKRYSVQSAVTHPDFNGKHPEMGHDLMLLFLETPVPSPHLVTLNSDATLPRIPSLLSVAGFGLTASDWSARPKLLQEVTDLLAIDCKDAPQSWFYLGAQILCVRSGPSGANLCVFDSGSPLLLVGNVQAGIASMIDSTSDLCANQFTGFTQISAYFDWIQANLPSSEQESNTATGMR